MTIDWNVALNLVFGFLTVVFASGGFGVSLLQYLNKRQQSANAAVTEADARVKDVAAEKEKVGLAEKVEGMAVRAMEREQELATENLELRVKLATAEAKLAAQSQFGDLKNDVSLIKRVLAEAGILPPTP